MRLLVVLFIVITSCISSAQLFAQVSAADAIARLKHMTEAFAALNYEGVFIYANPKQINSIQVRHQLIDGVEYESLLDLDGDSVQVLRVGDRVICVYPDKNSASSRGPLLTSLQHFENLPADQLALGYDFVVSPEHARIAGREAIEITLEPKDEYRYEHVFWLDVENNFLLKHVTLSTSGEPLERMQFTSLKFDTDLKAEDFAPKKGTYSELVHEEPARPIKNQWKFDWLPDGFKPVWPQARALNHGTSMLLLSDGMTTLSVFVEPSMKTKAMTVLSMGATLAGERSIKVGDQLYLLTMVGEVPEVTITKLMSVFMPRVQE